MRNYLGIFALMKQNRSISPYAYLLWVLVACVLLYFSFVGVEWSDFIDDLKTCRWILVIASMFVGLAAYIVRALRWRMLIRPLTDNVRLSDCYDGFAVGKFADTFIPHIGEFLRCSYVSRPPLKYDKALGTVLTERAWDILSLLVISVLTLALGWERFGSFVVEKIWMPSSQSLNFSLWWIVAAVLAVLVAAVVALLRLKDKNATCAKIALFLSGLWKGALSCLKMRGKWLFLLYTLLLWSLFLLMSLCIIWSLPDAPSLSWTDALFLMVVGSFASIVPVPGGFGAFHYMVALALSVVYGVPWASGIIFATLSHESQAAMAVICGSLAYIHQMFFRKKPYNERS